MERTQLSLRTHAQVESSSLAIIPLDFLHSRFMSVHKLNRWPSANWLYLAVSHFTPICKLSPMVATWEHIPTHSHFTPACRLSPWLLLLPFPSGALTSYLRTGWDYISKRKTIRYPTLASYLRTSWDNSSMTSAPMITLSLRTYAWVEPMKEVFSKYAESLSHFMPTHELNPSGIFIPRFITFSHFTPICELSQQNVTNIPHASCAVFTERSSTHMCVWLPKQ